MSLVILGFFAAGTLLAIVILPPVLDDPNGLQNDFWKGLALVVVFFSVSLILVYTTFFRPTDIGIRFHERGIEFGTTAETKAAAYESLEFLYFLPFSKTPFDGFLEVAHLVWGVATVSPTTIAQAMESRSAEPPLGEILLKAPSEEEVGIFVEKGQKAVLLELLKHAPQRRPGGDWAMPKRNGPARR
jgi:hypothetical protein